MSLDISKMNMTMRDVVIVSVFLIGAGITAGFVKWTGEANEKKIEKLEKTTTKEFDEVNGRVYNLNVRVEEYKSMQDINKALFQSYQENTTKQIDKLEKKIDYLIELRLEKINGR